MGFKVLGPAGVVLMLFLSSQAQGAEVKDGAQRAASAPTKAVSKKPVNVTSDRMETDKTDNTVTFSGNVAAEEDFILCTDELHVSYDENKEIKEIRAKGNVRILKEGKTAASDAALYDKKARTIILTGKAMVSQCSDNIRGEKIVYYIDTDRASAESGQGGRVKAAIISQKKCGEEEKANAAAGREGAPLSAEAWCKKNPALPR